MLMFSLFDCMCYFVKIEKQHPISCHPSMHLNCMENIIYMHYDSYLLDSRFIGEYIPVVYFTA